MSSPHRIRRLETMVEARLDIVGRNIDIEEKEMCYSLDIFFDDHASIEKLKCLAR